MSHIRSLRLVLLVASLTAGSAAAQGAPPDTTPHITFGAFVDGYYAWDFGRPPALDRSFAGGTPFTTQPARHNEFNVNLAFVEVKLDAARYRGRLAVQYGTSVQSNYSGEPTTGKISGPSLQQAIQEAVVGARLSEHVWVDGGIMFSNAGMEGWISRDNLTYTRALVSEYSPYYSSGVKLTYAPNARIALRVDVVNGWQNISENNTGKGAGLRLDFTPDPGTMVSYYNLLSDEAGNRLRVFNGAGFKAVRGAFAVLGQADVGTQSRAGATGHSTWYGLLAALRVQVRTPVALTARIERYDDPDQTIVSTGSTAVSAGAVANPALRANGASFGFDITPAPRLLWRSELRAFHNRDALFPDGASGAPRRDNAFVVTSLALTF